ncbi:MAG TPA: hypothetical protein VOB72_11710 [Candidatus Dormibacteraeota bacterium]|nr:hypothetical protein [Candidatus Dormibacteraeota bacterium]
MRRLSLALLAVAIVALTAAGLGTAARLGVFQSNRAPVGDSGLDPEALGGGGAGGAALPAGACPPVAGVGGASGSDADLAGPCAYHEAGGAYCHAAGDDFYVVVQRPLPAGRTLDLYLDVEFYKGPGAYRDAQMLLLIQEGTTLYTWSNFRTNVTVLPGEAGVRLDRTELTPEAGRAGSGVETVTGTLACGAPRPS